MIALGTVCELHRWPVKSMGGEPVDALRVDQRGGAGDRTHAIFDAARGKRLTAREAPRLLAWSAAYPQAAGGVADPAAPPLAMVTSPDGRELAWEDPELIAALQADLGRTVQRRRDLGGLQDLPRSLLLTTHASLLGLQDELGAPLDLRRFRTNIHALLDADAFAEEGWEGRTLQIGDARFALLHPCERCAIPTRDPDTQRKWPELLRHLAREHRTLFGINVRPLHAATIRVGDTITVS